MSVIDLLVTLVLAFTVLGLGYMMLTAAKMHGPQVGGGQAVPAVSGSTEPLCMNCASWDHAAGAQVMARFPAFKEAAEHVTPAEMAYGYARDPETDERVGLAGPPEAANLQWNQFGVCSKHSELRHKGDMCAAFSLVQIRVKP